MVTTNSSSLLSSSEASALPTALIATSSIALTGCLIAMVAKLMLPSLLPMAWKCCLWCQDVACVTLSLGVMLIACYIDGAGFAACKAGGFFAVFGVVDLLSANGLMGVTFLLIQDPSKMAQLTSFRWKVLMSLLVPQKLATFVLALIPVMPLDNFDSRDPYPLVCFPVRQEGDKGATFGAILFFILWSVLALSVSLCVLVAVRLWAGPGTRVHASSPSLWQMQKMEQGRGLHKVSMLEVTLNVLLLFVLTTVVYTNSGLLSAPQWIALLALVAVGLLHGFVAGLQLLLWSSLCCDMTGHKKEPHHRLKQLQLIRIEGPGKLRMKASWAAGRGIWRQGLLKVYGPAHIKDWAQEIVVLGLLRKSNSASVLHCLWTSHTNLYYEAMTRISGEIVTSDSRLTCLDLTSGGTLQDFVKSMEVPLAEVTQRTLLHDVAEGLACLHEENVLHGNLSSAVVYLKGSVQYGVLRAVVGDFEHAQIYGTLLTGSPSSTGSRNRFFFPDIRAYALVGLELVARVCECRQRQQEWHCQPVKDVTEKSKKSGGQLGQGDTQELTDRKTDHKLQGHHMPHCLPNSLPVYVTKRDPLWEVGEKPGTFLPILSAQLQSKTDTFPCQSIEQVSSDTRLAKYNTEQVSNDTRITEYNTEQVSNDTRITEYNTEQVSNYARLAEYSTEQVNDDTRLAEYNTKQDSNNTTLAEYSTEHLSTNNEEVNNGTRLAEYSIDENWKLQMRNVDHKEGSSWPSPGWQDESNTCTWQEDRIKANQRAGITHVQEVNFGQFPQNTRFRPVNGTDEAGESIEEEIEYSACNGMHKAAGYFRSRGKEGPAAYPAKTSGCHSSSGYGSSEHNSSATSAGFPVPKRVQTSLTTANISSFNHDILQVLPGVADVAGKPRRGEEMLKEMLQSRQEARQEALMLSYKDRVKKGELREDLDGVVWPKTNTKAIQGTAPFSTEADVTKTQDSETGEDTLPSMSHRVRPLSAAGSSFGAWNARSSLTRNKARRALKKALSKGVQSIQLHADHRHLSSTKSLEVEMKYAAMRKETSMDLNQMPFPCPKIHWAEDEKNGVAHFCMSSCHEASVQIQSGSKTRKKSPVKKPSAKTRRAPSPPLASMPTMSHVFTRQEDNFFTSLKPNSESNHHSCKQSSADQIESDMRTIIQDKALAVPPQNVRLIDSGFDSASVSSEESCLCAAAALQVIDDGDYSSPSELGTCSCACSKCFGSGQEYNNASSCTGSQDSQSWTNSNSFSSYEANMYRRKLPTRREQQRSSGGALAPDQQYPSPVRQNQLVTGRHYPSSASETSSAASRRYRELMKKGIPLRVSVVSGNTDGAIDTAGNTDGKAKSQTVNLDSASNFHKNLFEPDLTYDLTGDTETDSEDENRYQNLSPIPSLEEILKVIPDETGHFLQETNAFLKRPDSEVTLKVLQAVLSPRLTTDHGSSNNIAPQKPLEGQVTREAPPMSSSEANQPYLLDNMTGLLSGMDRRHVSYCQAISSRLHLINMQALIPANQETFQQLKMKLQHVGNIGTIGNQLLDLLQTCWLSEAPPSTAAIVEKLVDPVRETQL